MYRLFVKEPDEIKGTRVGDFDSIEDVRAAVRAVMGDRPEGTQAYVYRQSRSWGNIRPAEAYQIIDGEIGRIWSRWEGGRWPRVWSPKMGTPIPSERLKVKELLRLIGAKEDREVLKEFEGPDWAASKEEFLSRGPQTYELPGEKGRYEY